MINAAMLSFFNRVSLEPEASKTSAGQRLLSYLEAWEHSAADTSGNLTFTQEGIKRKGQKELLVSIRKGPFLKSCPGTPRYLCCGYRVLAWAEGCPLDCSYCVLPGYFQRNRIVLFANLGKLLGEVSSLAGKGGRINRLGTGEFTDSLFLEPLAGLHAELVPLIARSRNIVLEIKTKTDQVEPILPLDHKGRTITAWSLNAAVPAEKFEAGLPTPEQRIAASLKAASAGYKLAFHFDPLIHHNSWEQDYRRAVEMMADYLGKISPVWISMGCLRFPTSIFKSPWSREHYAEILQEEFHPGDDGKMRYLRPLRVRMYRHMARMLRKAFPRSDLYLCMENDDIWKASLDWAPSSSAVLARMLDEAALNALAK